MVANVLSDRISSPSSGCGKFWLPSRLTQTRYARQKGECPGGLRCASNFRQAVGLQIGRMSSLTSMGLVTGCLAGLAPGMLSWGSPEPSYALPLYHSRRSGRRRLCVAFLWSQIRSSDELAREARPFRPYGRAITGAICAGVHQGLYRCDTARCTRPDARCRRPRRR